MPAVTVTPGAVRVRVAVAPAEMLTPAGMVAIVAEVVAFTSRIVTVREPTAWFVHTTEVSIVTFVPLVWMMRSSVTTDEPGYPAVSGAHPPATCA